MRTRDRLSELIAPVVEGMGYELVGVEFDGRQRVLRVFIDSPAGINLDDCARISYQVSGLLDVEDPIAGRYQLEVSSPGIDRPLFELAHFERFAGEMVRLQLTHLIEGRRKFKALLVGVQGGQVVVEEDGTQFRIPFEAIEKARLSPEFGKKN